jgi:hypothetical protein
MSFPIIPGSRGGEAAIAGSGSAGDGADSGARDPQRILTFMGDPF